MKMMVLGCTVMNMESSIKDLLERWSQLEPQLCRQDIDTDEFDYSEVIYHVNNTPVYSTQYPENYYPDKDHSLARIQWVVQQAIIEHNFYYLMQYIQHDILPQRYWVVQLNGNQYHTSLNNPTEALLSAYLEMLEARKVTD